ncbi:MAG: DNA topoisomerase IB [Actinomycetota bacterium]
MARLHRIDPSSAPGIRRVRARGRFRYYAPDGGTVDAETRDRIRALVIPPAWAKVWISPDADSHIQAVGTDAAGRRQYLYHARWRTRRDLLKFDRALELAAALPAARAIVTRNLQSDDERTRALAVAFRIIDRTAVRIGSPNYLRKYGTRGLLTLRWADLRLDGTSMELSFLGKMNRRQHREFDDAELADWIRSQPARPRRATLLRYRAGRRMRLLTAATVNAYICDVTGGPFTAKDFRTLRGTTTAALSLADARAADLDREARELLAVDAVATVLGNTRAVARSSYIDPRVFRAARSGRLIDRDVSVETGIRRLLSTERPRTV